MTTKLSVSSYENGEVINPKDVVRFRIKTNLADEEVKSTLLKFNAPAWPPLITFIDATYTTSNISVVKTDPTPDEFRIKSYNITNIAKDSSNRRLTLLLENVPTGQVGDTYLVTASAASNLNPINGQSLIRIASLKTATNTKQIDFKVPIGLISPLKDNNLNTSINSVKLTKYKAEFTKYTLNVDNDKLQTRANRKNVLKDIIVFAYTTTVDDPKTTEQKYLLKESNLTTEISETSPPSYATVQDLEGQSGTIVSIEKDSRKTNNLVDIYVAIARYKNINSTWSGEWLQKDSNGNAIWKKMVGANR